MAESLRTAIRGARRLHSLVVATPRDTIPVDFTIGRATSRAGVALPVR